MPAYQVLLSKAARKKLNTLPVLIHNKIIEDKQLRILVIAIGHRKDVYE